MADELGEPARDDPTPSTQRIPPDTTANCGPMSAATTAASMSPSRGPLVTTRMWIDMTRPRRRVRRLELDERRAEDRREDVRGAGERRGQKSASGNETVTSPKAVMARPQHGDGERGSPARSAGPPRPSPRSSAPRNAPAAGAAASSPKPAGPGLEDVEREDREERRRHPEDHRVEVDHERAEDRAPLAGEAQALADRREPGPDRRRRAAATGGSRAGRRTTP